MIRIVSKRKQKKMRIINVSFSLVKKIKQITMQCLQINKSSTPLYILDKNNIYLYKNPKKNSYHTFTTSINITEAPDLPLIAIPLDYLNRAMSTPLMPAIDTPDFHLSDRDGLISYARCFIYCAYVKLKTFHVYIPKVLAVLFKISTAIAPTLQELKP
jgi:hypothetical protein